MAITINGVLCQELVADFGEGADIIGGPTAHKGYLCAWADRYTLAKGILGLSNSTSIGGSITLSTPMKYPELWTNMYARSIDIIPVGLPSQGTAQCQWTNAIVYANFGCMPWSFEGIDSGFYYQQIDPATPLIYCKQSIQTSTEYMTIPTVGLVTAAGNLLEQKWQMPLFRADITLTFMRVPYYPAQAIFTIGRSPMNSTTFLGLSASYVMFGGSSSEESRDTAGNFTRDITYLFKYRNQKWDYVWDGKAGAWSQVKTSGGAAMIASSDLNTLIPTGYRL